MIMYLASLSMAEQLRVGIYESNLLLPVIVLGAVRNQKAE